MILGLAAVLAACSGEKKDKPPAAAAPDPARPAEVSDSDVALAGHWVTLYGEYASAMQAAAEDCARVAAAIRQVNSKNADLLSKGKPRMAELRREPAAAKWLDDGYRQKLGAELDRMAPTLDRCRGDADVSAALAAGAFERKPD
jgi:hypothetical protein